MSFALTKLLSLLLYPLNQVLLLFLLALLLQVLRRLRSANVMLLVAFAWLYLCSTAPLADYLVGSLERDFPPRALSATGDADAIVLLGGAMRGYPPMGELPDLSQHADRLLHATALYKAGKAPLILLSGGAQIGVPPEALQMRDVLKVMGVPVSAMLLEKRSRTTRDNAVYATELLRDKGLNRVLLVTSAFHMRRAQAVFRAQGLEVVPAPTDFQYVAGPSVVPDWLPSVHALHRTTLALHELAGYQVYRWRGWL